MTSSSSVTRSSLQGLVPMEDPQPLTDLPTRVWDDDEWERIKLGYAPRDMDELGRPRRGARGAVGNFESVVWPAGGAWPADGEDLAEGDVEAWLGGMANPLRECGVELEIDTTYSPWSEGSTGYSIGSTRRRSTCGFR